MKKFFIWQDEIVIKTALNCGFTVELFSRFFTYESSEFIQETNILCSKKWPLSRSTAKDCQMHLARTQQ